MSIAILLATYNSEKYLKVQIDSLLNQTYKDFTLYIRDDGSDDGTLSIVEEYCNRHSNIVLLEDHTKGRRSMGSFMWLLEHVESEYYMFCDHDDYWLPTKIEMTLKQMQLSERSNPQKAVVVHTDLQVVDEALNIIDYSFWSYCNINRHILSRFDYLAFCNFVTGCTMMLNNRAKELSLPLSGKAFMHDHWIALCTLGNGGVLETLEEAPILYRQHSSNVLGATQTPKFSIMSKLHGIKKTIEVNKRTFQQIRAIKKYSAMRYIFYKLLYLLKYR